MKMLFDEREMELISQNSEYFVSHESMAKMGLLLPRNMEQQSSSETEHKQLLKAFKHVDGKKLYTSTLDNMFIIPNANGQKLPIKDIIRVNSLFGADSISIEQRQERPSARDNRRVYRTLNRCYDIDLNKLFEYVHRNQMLNFEQFVGSNILAQVE